MMNKIKICILVVFTGFLLAIIGYTTGLPFFDSIKYYLYLLFYILLPGWCIYVLIFPKSENWQRQICVGLVLGYIAEVIVYLVMGLLKISIIEYSKYAIIFVLCGCLPFVYKKIKKLNYASETIRSKELFYFLLVSALVVLSVKYYSINQVPLPSDKYGVTYYQDMVWHTSLSAEAKWHNLPYQNPSVAGESLKYYHFPYIHIAMASAITGLEISKVLLRLFPMELYFLWSFMLCWAGKELIGGWKNGVILATFVLLLGSFSGPIAIYSSIRNRSMEPLFGRDYFHNYIFWAPFNSPTFLLGALFFIALMALVYVYLKNEKYKSSQAEIIVIGVLFFAAAFIKSVLLVFFVLGLAGLLLCQLINRGKHLKQVIYIFAIAAIILLSTKWYTQVLYVDFMKLNFLYPVLNSDISDLIYESFSRNLPSFLWMARTFSILVFIIGYLPLPTLGFIIYLIYKRKRLSLSELWIASLFLIPFLTAMLFSFSGGEWNFLIYGSISLSVIAIKGLNIYFGAVHSRKNAVYLKMAIVLIIILSATTMVTKCMFPTIGTEYYKKRYGPNSLMTGELYSALNWIKNNTNKDDVIMVNYTQELQKEKKNWYYSKYSENEKYWYYSAFAERRIFLEGTFNTPQYSQWSNIFKESEEKIPFKDRRELIEKVFVKKDKLLISRLKVQYDISYLLNDRRRSENEWLKSLSDILRLVYSNKDADVYLIRR